MPFTSRLASFPIFAFLLLLPPSLIPLSQCFDHRPLPRDFKSLCVKAIIHNSRRCTLKRHPFPMLKRAGFVPLSVLRKSSSPLESSCGTSPQINGSTGPACFAETAGLVLALWDEREAPFRLARPAFAFTTCKGLSDLAASDLARTQPWGRRLKGMNYIDIFLKIPRIPLVFKISYSDHLFSFDSLRILFAIFSNDLFNSTVTYAPYCVLCSRSFYTYPSSRVESQGSRSPSQKFRGDECYCESIHRSVQWKRDGRCDRRPPSLRHKCIEEAESVGSWS